MLLKSKESKVVFVAFMQHCIQSTVISFVTHVERVESVKYYVLYTEPLTPARREGYLRLPSWGLAVHHQSVRGGSFVNFLGLVKLQG